MFCQAVPHRKKARATRIGLDSCLHQCSSAVRRGWDWLLQFNLTSVSLRYFNNNVCYRIYNPDLSYTWCTRSLSQEKDMHGCDHCTEAAVLFPGDFIMTFPYFHCIFSVIFPYFHCISIDIRYSEYIPAERTVHLSPYATRSSTNLWPQKQGDLSLSC